MSFRAESKHAEMMALTYRGRPLPQSWTQVTIADIGEVVTGNTPPRSEASHYGEYLPFVKPGDLEVSGFVQTAEEYLSETGAEKARVIPANSVMVTCIASLGKTGISGRMVATNQQINSIIVSATVDPKYVYYFCLSSGFQEAIETNASATTVAILNKSKFSRLPIILAPIREQRRIVDEIETQFARLDTAVSDLRRLQHNLDRYRASTLKAAFEGRLVPQDPADEPAEQLLQRILAERRRRWEEQEWQKHVERAQKKAAQARRKAAGRPARLSDLEPEEWQAVPEEEYRAYLPKGKKWNERYEEPPNLEWTEIASLPVNWTLTTLGQLKLFSLYGPRFSSEDYADEGYAVLRTTDISDSGKVDYLSAPKLPLGREDFEKYRCEIGDLLITRTGSLGTLAVFNDDLEAIPGAYLIQYRLAAPQITSWFVYYFLKSPVGHRHLIGGGAGVGRPNLNAPTIEAIDIPLPPLAEQGRIVAEVERLVSIIDELRNHIDVSISRADRLRQAILEKAFTGRLVPQDPDDEPAEKLLETIRAARNGDRSQQLSLFHEEPS